MKNFSKSLFSIDLQILTWFPHTHPPPFTVGEKPDETAAGGERNGQAALLVKTPLSPH